MEILFEVSFLFFFLTFGMLLLFLTATFTPFLSYFDKIETRCRERMDSIVIETMAKEITEHCKELEPLEADESRPLPYLLGLSFSEYDKLSKKYPLNNPMKYCRKAIHKASF